MSWSPDLYIGELRPWPDSVHVVRGKTDEARRYTPERKDAQAALERRIDELCAEVEAEKQRNAKLRELMYERAHVYAIQNMTEDELRITAANVMEDNAKLRELEGHMLRCMKRNSDCDYCLANGEHCEISYIEADALELGIEVPS